jgi:hypothetical protein
MRKLQSAPKDEFFSSPNDYEDGLTTRVDVSRLQCDVSKFIAQDPIKSSVT